MKLKPLALAVAVAFGPIATVHAAYPVNVVSDPQAWVAHLEDIAKAVEQIRHLEQQIQQMEREYKSMTGSRGLANVIDSVYDSDALGDIQPLEVLRQHGINTSEAYTLSKDVAELYDLSGNNAATYSGVASKSLIQAEQRFQDLQGLVAKVNDSNDPKEIMDLQARVGAEGTFLQNEVAKLQVLEQDAQARRALYDQKVKQMSVESSGSLRQVDW